MKLSSAVIFAMALSAGAQAAQEVAIVPADKAAACRHIKHEVCTTTSMDPQKACHAWHQEHAAEAGADAVVMGKVDENRRKRPSLSGMKTVITTRMEADYYHCGFMPAQPQGRPMHETGAGKTVEERLRRLDALKQKGLITGPEYQSKRQDILDDL